MNELVLKSQDQNQLVGELLDAVRDGRLPIEILVTPLVNGTMMFQLQFPCAKNEQGINQNEWLDCKDAAKLLGHSVWWLSRKKNRVNLGISAHKVGGKCLFKRKELIAIIEKMKENKRGRPKKMLSVEQCK